MRKVIPLLLIAFALSGCASVLKRTEQLTRDSIQASEDNRCTVHAAPCLSDAQFKHLNAQLANVAATGASVTLLAKANTAKPSDYGALVKAALDVLAALQSDFPQATFLSKWNSLIGSLQQKAGA
jgi:hypothetical protein